MTVSLLIGPAIPMEDAPDVFSYDAVFFLSHAPRPAQGLPVVLFHNNKCAVRDAKGEPFLAVPVVEMIDNLADWWTTTHCPTLQMALLCLRAMVKGMHPDHEPDKMVAVLVFGPLPNFTLDAPPCMMNLQLSQERVQELSQDEFNSQEGMVEGLVRRGHREGRHQAQDALNQWLARQVGNVASVKLSHPPS